MNNSIDHRSQRQTFSPFPKTLIQGPRKLSPAPTSPSAHRHKTHKQSHSFGQRRLQTNGIDKNKQKNSLRIIQFALIHFFPFLKNRLQKRCISATYRTPRVGPVKSYQKPSTANFNSQERSCPLSTPFYSCVSTSFSATHVTALSCFM